MDLERLSGLLLGIVALATLAYLLKEIVAMRMSRPLRIGDLTAACKRALSAVAAQAGADAKPVNEHLVAAEGKVVAHSADEARPLRVRVGLERWSARLRAPEPTLPAVGTPIRVTAVEDSILVVEARILSDDEAEETERK